MNAPIVALVGRPNVGKSTLYNRLTHTKNALVADEAGLTRDRQYGTFSIDNKSYHIIDTGGINQNYQNDNPIDKGISEQVSSALKDADIIYFLLSSKEGLTHEDSNIAKQLRLLGKTILLVANKSDGLKKNDALDFYQLGLGEPILISAEHNQGINVLLEKTIENTPEKLTNQSADDNPIKGIAIAILGTPNAGKSTLINHILGENRVLTSDVAGTTRDSIYIPFHYRQKQYTLIDTAGIRRKRSVNNKIEKFSIIKSIEALENAHIALLIIDAKNGITEQDATLLGMIVDKGRALMIVVNKWDGLDAYQKQEVKRRLDVKLSFINYAPIYFISALTGSGVNKLFKPIGELYAAVNKTINTSLLNRQFEKIVVQHQPPLVKSKRIKLKFIHQASICPPTFIIHGAQAESTPENYQTYLKNALRKALSLNNIPIRINFKNAANPFSDKKNTLTKRQIDKKRRLMKFVKR